MNEDFLGKKYGMLTVIKIAEDYVSPKGSHHARFTCKCDCGNTKTVLKEHLLSGAVQSCGCKHKGANKTHGDINSRLYRIWGNMLNRCDNPNNPAYKNYGGRGITACEDWHDYISFKSWAKSSGYKADMTIERIDNNKGYEPSNCKWANRYEQGNNKRNNRLVTYNGKTQTVAEWARELNIPYKTLAARIERGWSATRAFSQPLRKSPSK